MNYMKIIDGQASPLTAEEITEFEARKSAWEAGANDRAAEEVRKERDDLLASSDWTQVADAPVDQAAWAAYRQALRNVPQQAGFPTDITWPTKPE